MNKKWIAAGILSVLAVFILLKVLTGFAEKRIASMLDEGPIPNHLISYKNIDVHIIPPGLTIERLEVEPDSSRKVFTDPESSSDIDWIYCDPFDLEIKGFSLTGFLIRKAILIGSVTLDMPVVNILKSTSQPPEGPDTLALELMGNPLRHLRIGEFYIRDGTLGVAERKPDGLQVHLREWNAAVSGLMIGMNPVQGNISSKSIMMGAGAINLILPGSMYSLDIINLILSSESHSLALDSLCMTPLYDKEEFATRAGYQTDRITSATGKVTAAGFFLDSLFYHRKLIIGSIIIARPKISLFRDKNFPVAQGHRPELPHHALMNAGIQIDIDSITVVDGWLLYEEIEEGNENAGQVYLDEIALKANGVNNILSERGGEDLMTVAANAMLMGEGALELNIEFPLSENPDGFSFSGSLRDFNLSRLNDITDPNMYLRITSGYASYTGFRANAGFSEATGRLRMYYKDLDLSLLKRPNKYGKEENILTRTATAVARGFLHRENPDSNKERIGKMNFERDPQKSFLNYMIKTLISGIEAIMLPGKRNVVIEEENTEE